MDFYCTVCKEVTDHEVEDGFGYCLECENVIDSMEIMQMLELNAQDRYSDLGKELMYE